MTITAVFAGNPNCGKTSLFNSIAGTRYKVGNYSGVTVEKKDAEITHKGKKILITDLPGTYSLTAYSIEEIVARDYIIDNQPDVVVNIVDASNIERNLYLTVQLLELGLPLIIVLNMVDVAKSRGINIDSKKLSEKLKVPVIETVAREGIGKEELLDAIAESDKIVPNKNFKISYGPDIGPAILEMEKIISENNFLTDKYNPRWTAIKYLENDEEIIKKGSEFIEVHEKLMVIVKRLEIHLKKTLNTYPEGVIADYRYGYVNSLLKNIVKKKANQFDRLFLSDKVDLVLTNRFFGPVIMLLILYGVYKFTFYGSEIPTIILNSVFSWLTDIFNTILPNGFVKSLIVNGIIGGVGGIIGFAPLIFLMFIIIAILEDSGYMARMAYMLDRVFRIFGLQGSSVVPFIVSGGIAGGCAVPGVMAARTIKGSKERILTMLTAPFMPCGAKVPVYAMIIAAFYKGDKGLIMMLITIMSWIVALVMAKFLSKTVVKGQSSSFVMELPPYRLPTLKGVLTHAWERTWMYVKKAGTIILAVTILLWFLMSFPGLSENKMKTYEQKKHDIISLYDKDTLNKALTLEEDKLTGKALELKKSIQKIEVEQASERLRNSFAGKIGSLIEPVSKWAGFDWRFNIALIGGVMAKEVIISTLGTAYSLEESASSDQFSSLSEKLKENPDWTIANALALMIFIMLYSPCYMTIMAIIKESGTWKWGVFTLVFYSLLAFGSAVLVYQLFS